MTKKVLIITYHWPPSGGITVLRCLKFVKYLREFGWEPIIFTAKNAPYQFIDNRNEKDIPENIEVHKVPIFEPTQLFKKLSGRKPELPLQNFTSNSEKKKNTIDNLAIWIRGNFFIPDARARWIRPSINYLSNYLKSHHVDAILTDGPPHTNTVIGMRLSQKFKIPWLADFQDPWTQVDYYSKMKIGRRADKKHRELEQEVFRTANKITIASPSWKVDLESIGAKNVEVIYYGYDEADFSDYNNKEVSDFTIFHGGLLGEDRNPESLFAALKVLIDEQPQLKANIRLRLAGEVDFSVRKSIEKCGLNDQTTYLGMIPRQDVYAEYERAKLLLLPINKASNAKGRIPGKLFEMLRTNKPILVFGPEDGDVKGIVEAKQRGKSFEYHQVDEISLFLKKLILQKTPEVDHAAPSITEFSNKEITRKIARYLDEITSKSHLSSGETHNCPKFIPPQCK